MMSHCCTTRLLRALQLAVAGCALAACAAHGESVATRSAKPGIQPAAKPAAAAPDVAPAPAAWPGAPATRATPAAAQPLRNVTPLQLEVDGIPQDFAFDPDGGQVFVQALRRSPNGGEELGFVYRLELGANGNARIAGRNVASDVVGHQGISVEGGSNGNPWLWVSRSGDNGRTAVRFAWRPDVVPDAPQVYTLFPAGYMDRNVTMPKVCSDGRHLIARGRTSPREQFIRVFRLTDLVRGGPGDYSSRHLKEWRLPADVLATGLPVQGLACDSGHVYVVLGNARLNEPKIFLSLTLDGTLEQRIDDFSASQAVAAADGKQFEPEGLSVLPARNGRGDTVHVGVLSGNSRNLRFRLWPFVLSR